MSNSSGYYCEAVPASGARGRFAAIDDQPVLTPSPGVHFQSVLGDGVLLCRVTLDPGAEAPVHTHEEEQLGIVLSGGGDFHLNGQVQPVLAGDTYHAPPGVAHGLRAGAEGCVVIDVFAPPRAALVELLRSTPGEDRQA